jgi:hypothetical protein
LIEAPASETVDTSVHFVLDEGTQILIMVGPFLSRIAPDTMAARNCFILEETVPTFVTNRAVMGVVLHIPLDDIFSELHSLFVGGGYHHAVLRIRHAAHVHPLERSLYKLHRTQPARPHRAQGRMETKPWDHDPKLLSRIYDFGPYRNLYF